MYPSDIQNLNNVCFIKNARRTEFWIRTKPTDIRGNSWLAYAFSSSVNVGL
jgi:hypothetical protein